jgi:hypothetical protein
LLRAISLFAITLLIVIGYPIFFPKQSLSILMILIINIIFVFFIRNKSKHWLSNWIWSQDKWRCGFKTDEQGEVFVCSYSYGYYCHFMYIKFRIVMLCDLCKFLFIPYPTLFVCILFVGFIVNNCFLLLIVVIFLIFYKRSICYNLFMMYWEVKIWNLSILEHTFINFSLVKIS